MSSGGVQQQVGVVQSLASSRAKAAQAHRERLTLTVRPGVTGAQLALGEHLPQQTERSGARRQPQPRQADIVRVAAHVDIGRSEPTSEHRQTPARDLVEGRLVAKPQAGSSRSRPAAASARSRRLAAGAEMSSSAWM